MDILSREENGNESDFTFVFGADHAISLESAKVAVAAQTEIVLGPLEHAGLVEDAASHNDRFAHNCRLVFGFALESLHQPERLT